MKFEVQTYFNRLQLVATGERHRNYKRTVEYAEELKNIICAEEESKSSLLKQYNRRETKEEFEKSLDHTELLTRAMSERIFAPVDKGSRNDQIHPEFKWKDNKVGNDTEKAIQKFYSDKSLYQYCIEHILSTVKYDPNAFVLMQFKEFNPNIEKPKPEAVIIPSSSAVDYNYENGELDYLIVHSSRYGHYTLYLPDYNIRLTEVKEDKKATDVDTSKGEFHSYEALKENKITLIKVRGKLFSFGYTEEVKAERVQAERIGFRLDTWTGGETCVSLVHPAIPRIKRTLQKSRNLSLNLDLHTFNQKIQVVRSCGGYENDTCNGGKNNLGETCQNCKGSGLEPYHQGPQDVIEVPLSRNQADQIDIDKVIKYIQPETETTKLLWEFEKENTNESFNDVYTSNAFSQVSATKTATEVTVSYESVHDKVHPEFSQGLRKNFRFMAGMIATFLDEKSSLESVDLKVPSDLQLYTLQELISQYKAAKDSGAPIQVLKKIKSQILSMINKDDDMQVRKDAAMMLHEPMSDKTKEEIQFGVSNGYVRKKDAVLFMNYEQIMNRVFQKLGDKFFAKEYSEQQKAIDEEVTLLMQEIAAESSATLNL